MSTKRTPTPWRVYEYGREPDDGWPLVSFRDFIIMSPPMKGDSLGSQEADAQHIVHCVNTHDEMLAALKGIIELTGSANRSSFEQIKQAVNGCLELAEAAIAKAETQS